MKPDIHSIISIQRGLFISKRPAVMEESEFEFLVSHIEGLEREINVVAERSGYNAYLANSPGPSVFTLAGFVQEQQRLVETLRNETLFWQKEHRKSEVAIEALRAEVARCHERLEIDHCWQAQADGSISHIEIPEDARAGFPDGISCRDETIDLQDERIESMALEIHRKNETLRWIGEHAGPVNWPSVQTMAKEAAEPVKEL